MFKRMPFTRRFCLCLMVLMVLALLMPAFYTYSVMQESMWDDAKDRAVRELQITSAILDTSDALTVAQDIGPDLKKQNIRLTLIHKGGMVFYDNSLNSQEVFELDNHADRPEFMQASGSNVGLSVRYSNTLKTNYIYVAKQNPQGDIVRLAVPYTGLEDRMEKIVYGLLYISILGLIFATIVTFAFSSWIKVKLTSMVEVVEEISLGNYSSRLYNIFGAEFAPLAEAVNRMANNIESQVNIMNDQAAQVEGTLNTLDEAVLLLDIQGNIQRVNNALYSILGDKSLSVQHKQVIEYLPAVIIQKNIEAAIEEAKQNTKETGISFIEPKHFEVELLGRHYMARLASPENPTDHMAFVLVLHDVTELMRLESIRRDFVSNVSHELRTPLTAIQGYAETLMYMDDLPEDCQRFAKIIHKHGKYLSVMVDDLLSLARIENNKDDIVLSPVPLEGSLETALSFCESALKERHLEVEKQDLAGVLVQASRLHLERVFRNLLENACRYADPQSTIRVGVQKNKTKCTVFVENIGEYIAEDQQSRIFERFYCVEKSRSQYSTGLGLAICKHIIEKHGGSIWVESKQEENYAVTTFYFTLNEAE